MPIEGFQKTVKKRPVFFKKTLLFIESDSVKRLTKFVRPSELFEGIF